MRARPSLAVQALLTERELEHIWLRTSLVPFGTFNAFGRCVMEGRCIYDSLSVLCKQLWRVVKTIYCWYSLMCLIVQLSQRRRARLRSDNKRKNISIKNSSAIELSIVLLRKNQTYCGCITINSYISLFMVPCSESKCTSL